MKLIDMTVKDFVNEVDSKSPAPGGGAVAALASDLGVGVSRMMAHLTFGKQKYDDLDEDIKVEFEVKFDKLGKIRDELSKLVDEDAKSFSEYMKALKMPKNTFKQTIERQKALADSTLYSIQVPYKIATLSYEAINELEFLLEYGNKNVITDVGVGALLLCTGLEGAILNVKVNLSNLEDEELAKKYADSCEKMLPEGKNIRDKILSKVYKAIE